jgi:AraC family transcriptional regulator of adaptative response / DNA-3-methyladenine glycosylase II
VTRPLRLGTAGRVARCRFRLTYRPPYDWDALLAFFAARATPGVECVGDSCYRRTIAIDGASGTLSVAHRPSQCAIGVDVRIPESRSLLAIGERVRRIFDLDCNPQSITEHLGGDSLLRGALAVRGGVRLPGAWDPFELGVRAIIGQQVSVRAATTIAGRVASMFGSPVAFGGTLNRLFPTAAQLVDAPLERVGLMPTRANTLRSLARAVLEGSVSLDAAGGMDAAIASLERVRGIGPWTSHYIAMRAFQHADAFMPGDLVLRRVAGGCSPRELERRSHAWRPWRAYAVILLWQSAVDEANQRRNAHGRSAAATRRDYGRVSAHGVRAHSPRQ